MGAPSFKGENMKKAYYPYECKARVTVLVTEIVHATSQEHADETFTHLLEYEYGECEIEGMEISRVGEKITEADQEV